MATLKSPGQKKRQVIRIISVLIFLAVTAVASIAYGFVKTQQLAWVKDHKEAQGTVTELSHVEEEYRNRKGKKRYRDVYSLSYSFSVDGDRYSNTVEVSESLFLNSDEQQAITVWYENGYPSQNSPKQVMIAAKASNNPVGNAITVAPFTFGGSLFLYYLLSFIFVRESKHSLPEGFYTENTWLDVDDNYFVALDDADLVFFDIDKGRASKVQQLYQQGAALEEIIGASKANKLNRVPISAMKQVRSDHNSDTIQVETEEKTYSVEFLNQALKAHALERIKALLPEAMTYDKEEKTRIKSALPALTLATLFIVPMFFITSPGINLVIGFIIVAKILPRILVRLWDPTITEKWALAAA
jgi:hypothetical protein